MNTTAVQSDITAFARKYNLDFVVLFGSQATGRTHAKSDIDIAVISRGKVDVPRLMSELSEIFKHDDVQVINLAHASPVLMRVVVKEGKLLYEKVPGSFFEWKLYAIKIWMETSWLRNLRNKKIKEWSVKTI